MILVFMLYTVSADKSDHNFNLDIPQTYESVWNVPHNHEHISVI